MSPDEKQSANRVADIRAGLLGVKADRWCYRFAAERRVQALTEDGEIFGLLPYEEAELYALKAMLVTGPND